MSLLIPPNKEWKRYFDLAKIYHQKIKYTGNPRHWPEVCNIKLSGNMVEVSATCCPGESMYYKVEKKVLESMEK